MRTIQLQRLLVGLLVLITVIGGPEANVWAQTSVLDQEFDAVPGDGSTGGTGIGFANGNQLAQTFIVGITGVLTRVDLQVFVSSLRPGAPAENLIVEIRPTIGGVPSNNDSSVLATTEVPPSAIPVDGAATQTFTTVDFSESNLTVVAGDVLAIVLRTSDTEEGYAWTHKENGTYTGGGAFFRNVLFSSFASLNRTGGIPVDLGFRTFVASSLPPPTPVDLDIGFLRVRGPGASTEPCRPLPFEMSVRLAVFNSSETDEPRIATIVGVQSGAEVYRESLLVSAPLGGARRIWTFPTFFRDARGPIGWTARIQDDDPDDDLADVVTGIIGNPRCPG